MSARPDDTPDEPSDEAIAAAFEEAERDRRELLSQPQPNPTIH